jgi:hypothetical protein
MSTDAKVPFLGCDSERVVCAIPHGAGQAPEGLDTPSSEASGVGAAAPADGAAATAAGTARDGTEVADKEVRREPEARPLAEAEGCPRQASGDGPWTPERPIMEILFRCIEAGRRYYSVRLNGQEIFVGTRAECDRFLRIHDQKVAEEQAEARRVPRGRPAQLRIYRTLRA